VIRPDTTEATRRLSDLRRAQPGDATLRNLLSVLNSKMELCASLPVFEWEAGSEGWPDRAEAFRDLAESERQSCADLLEELRLHLEQRTALEGSA
jgi:hypothetical protein